MLQHGRHAAEEDSLEWTKDRAGMACFRVGASLRVGSAWVSSSQPGGALHAPAMSAYAAGRSILDASLATSTAHTHTQGSARAVAHAAGNLSRYTYYSKAGCIEKAAANPSPASKVATAAGTTAASPGRT